MVVRTLFFSITRGAGGIRNGQLDRTIGVQQPDKVDAEKVRASLPHGIVTVKVVKGGLDVADPENNDPAVIASAAVEVKLELP